MRFSRFLLLSILFSLSLSVVSEFNPSLHQDSVDERIHQYIVDSSCEVDHDTLCDTCHCPHIRSMLDDGLRIPYVSNAKPYFESKDFLLTSNTPQLLKPPIA